MSSLTQDSHFVQGSPEWLSFRKKKIGASDAPIIMGVSPWTTPYQLWLQKLGLTPEKQQTAAMVRGVHLEQEAREKFAREIGVEVSPRVLVHSSHSWMICSLDGLDKDKKVAVEIKCPKNEKDILMAKNGEIPEKYYPQLQHQMEVAELDKMYYYSFDGENGVIVPVSRDDKFIAKMVKEEEKFYECMQNFISPKLSDDDYEVREDEKWASLIAQWKPIRDQLIILKELEENLHSQIINAASGKNVMGCGVKVTRSTRKGAIDYSKIPELQGVNLEKYRKELVEFYKICDV